VGLLADTVADGGNLILNLGPDSAGVVPIAQEQLLRAVGRWLNVSGEAIFGTEPRAVADGKVGESVEFDSGSGSGSGSESSRMDPLVQAGVCVAVPRDSESNSTAGVAYLGKPAGGSSGCTKACASYYGGPGSKSGPCFSFSYFDGAAGAPAELAGQCYGRLDTDWSPIWQAGCSSGRRGVARVAYTVVATNGSDHGSDRETVPVLHAILRPYPNLGGFISASHGGADGSLNITLHEPVVAGDASGLSARLVGYGELKVGVAALGGSSGNNGGLTLSLPPLPGWGTVRGSGDAVAIRIEGAR